MQVAIIASGKLKLCDDVTNHLLAQARRSRPDNFKPDPNPSKPTSHDCRDAAPGRHGMKIPRIRLLGIFRFWSNMAAKEYLYFRDSRLSERHRLYGSDCPMADIDQIIWFEYQNRIPVALIEYKFHTADRDKVLKSANSDGLRNLANLAGLPAFVAFYDPSRWVYRVEPLNQKAQKYFPKKYFTECEFVLILYRLRGLDAPQEVLDRLNATKQPLDVDDDD